MPSPPDSPEAPDTRPEQPPNCDFSLCKTAFGAVVSQIMYTRRSFSPSSFQTLPFPAIQSSPFDDIISSGVPVGSFDQDIFIDRGSAVFLRADPRDFYLSSFLGILCADIFPLLEKRQLIKFRVSFLRGSTWREDNLLEHYTFVFRYVPDGCHIDVWRAGIGATSSAETGVRFDKLGQYFSQLSPLKGPTYCTLAFHATERPCEPSIGLWGFDHTDFEDANLKLQQRKGYCYERVVCMEIETPDLHENPPHPQAFPDDQELDIKSAPQVYDVPVEGDTRSNEAEPAQLDASSSPHSVARAPGKKAKPKPTSQAKNRRKQPPPVPRTTRSKKPRKSPDVKTPDTEVAKNVQSTVGGKVTGVPGRHETSTGKKKGTSAKRKPKPPLTIFEDVNSKLPETQEANNKSQRQRELQHGKRPVIGTGAASTKQRPETQGAVHPESSYPRPLRQIDGTVTSPGLSDTTRGHARMTRSISGETVEEDELDEILTDVSDDIEDEGSPVVQDTHLAPRSSRHPTGSITRTLSVVSETSLNNIECNQSKLGKRKRSFEASDISNVDDESEACERQGKRHRMTEEISDDED